MIITDLRHIARQVSMTPALQKAIDFYNQSLPIAQLVGNRLRQATSLGNIGRL